MDRKHSGRAYIAAIRAIKWGCEKVKSAILFAIRRFVPRRGKGPYMSAENDHPENGAEEARSEGAVATGTDRLVDLEVMVVEQPLVLLGEVDGAPDVALEFLQGLEREWPGAGQEFVQTFDPVVPGEEIADGDRGIGAGPVVRRGESR